MNSKNFLIPLYNIFLLLVCICPKAVNSLEAIQAAKLPQGGSVLSLFYDGHSDTIFVFGVDGAKLSYDILSFSLTSHILRKVGQIPSAKFKNYIPVIQSSNDSHIFCLASEYDSNSTEVFKFNPLDGSSTKTGEIAIDLSGSVFSRSNEGSLHAIGGDFLQDKVVKLNLEDETLEFKTAAIVGQYIGLQAAAKVGNKSFILGHSKEESVRPVHLISLDLDTMEVNNPKVFLPAFVGDPAVTANKDYMFMIGGYSGGPFSNGIVRLNGTTETLEFLPIRKFPLFEGANYDAAPSAVWVEKFNRIYFFGGVQHTSLYLMDDRIWYINLNDYSESDSIPFNSDLIPSYSESD